MIDFFQANMWLLWTLICVICLILEVTSGDFFFMSFALGAIGAAIAATITPSFVMQLIVWGIVSVLFLFLVRPFVLKYLHKKEKHLASNADALIGKEGVVKEAIEPGQSGYVAIDGDMWKAVSNEAATIPVGTTVKVVSRKSIIITVEPT